MFESSTSFQRKAASLPKMANLLWYLPKMANLLWYLTKDLNLLGQFDRNAGLSTKFALVKVSENVKKDEPLSQT